MQEVFDEIIFKLKEEAGMSRGLSESSIDSFAGQAEVYEHAIDMIKQTTIECNADWITVDKRLPKVEECSMYNSINNEHQDIFWVTIQPDAHTVPYTTKLHFCPERSQRWYKDCECTVEVDKTTVIAWMSINHPEPYKPER